MKKFSKYYETLGVLIVIAVLTDYIIYPGLTVSNSFLNLLTVILSIIVIGITILFIDERLLKKREDRVIQPGETEYDYIPKDEIVKKKRATKKKDEPSVKPKKKSEFPMKPHDKLIKSKTKNK